MTEIKNGQSCPWSWDEQIDVLVSSASKSAQETLSDVTKYLAQLDSTQKEDAANRLLCRALCASVKTEVLVKYGADHYSALIEELLFQGANPNKWDINKHYTPFLLFCQHPENYETMKLLINNGDANVNAADNWDRGGFRLVVAQSSAQRPSTLKTVNLFLDHGVDLSLPCNSGILHVSHGLDDETIIRLINSGANVNHLEKERVLLLDLKDLDYLNTGFSSPSFPVSVLDCVARPTYGQNPDRIRFWISQGARHFRDSTVENIRSLGIEYNEPALEQA